ncbi:A Disintegrin And Metalloproteinase With Thrombospondin Motifs 7 [Manis pentadactyla]|nr:A Disintegrin And Metalloproteinase With Thrombospondin Motifs 7 [Manis pentadactyla]
MPGSQVQCQTLVTLITWINRTKGGVLSQGALSDGEYCPIKGGVGLPEPIESPKGGRDRSKFGCAETSAVPCQRQSPRQRRWLRLAAAERR